MLEEINSKVSSSITYLFTFRNSKRFTIISEDESSREDILHFNSKPKQYIMITLGKRIIEQRKTSSLLFYFQTRFLNSASAISNYLFTVLYVIFEYSNLFYFSYYKAKKIIKVIYLLPYRNINFRR